MSRRSPVRPLPQLLSLVFLVPGTVACGSWPRHAHLPDAGDTTPVGGDPRSAIEISWQSTPSADVDQPPGLDLGALAPESGLLVAGELLGAGWSDGAMPVQLSSAACGSSGTRAPIAGDYRADVDVVGFVVPDGGTLCVSAGVGASDLGFDLLLFEIDACGVPVRLVEGDDGSPLGFGGVGPSIRWSANVDGPSTWAVLLAGYAPNDDTTSFPYELGISLREAHDALCPLRPGEVAP